MRVGGTEAPMDRDEITGKAYDLRLMVVAVGAGLFR